MGAGYFVIAILGCADGGALCTPVATLQTRYSSEAQCAAATGAALVANSNFDFPTLLARCRSGLDRAAAEAEPERAIPASARRG
jgi:acyl-CoA synthetase (AMP-forming)/AMP-acid ligase II